MFKIPSLDKLVHELGRFPGVGPKSAQRLTHYILKHPQFSKSLRESMASVESDIKLCTQCFNYTDNQDGLCHICKSPRRNGELICVVEQPEDILHLESSGAYDGFYHVLHGAISPLEGITPEKLKINELMDRLEKDCFTEVILAVDSDLEGDTTVLYLDQQLQPYEVRVTRLAQGIPMGSDIDYIDDRTLHRALSYRVEV